MSDATETDNLRDLRELPRLDMDAAAARRVRDLAVAAHARSRDRCHLPAAGLYRRVLEPILVGGLSLGFLAWVVGRSLEILRRAPGGLL